MTTRKAHPARTLRDLDRSQRTLDAQRNERVNGASWDMSWDLSVNDGGARVCELAAASRSLCDQAEDIRAARLIVLAQAGRRTAAAGWLCLRHDAQHRSDALCEVPGVCPRVGSSGQSDGDHAVLRMRGTLCVGGPVLLCKNKTLRASLFVRVDSTAAGPLTSRRRGE